MADIGRLLPFDLIWRGMSGMGWFRDMLSA